MSTGQGAQHPAFVEHGLERRRQFAPEIDKSELRMRFEEGGDHLLVLLRLARARGVDQPPSWLYHGSRSGEQARLPDGHVPQL
jgi:hypothetical protein